MGVCTLVCRLIPLLWLGMVPLCSLRPGLLYYASAQWPATHTHKHTPQFSTPLLYPSLPPALAFNSQDKGSWCLACWDLIAKPTSPSKSQALSTSVPLLTETCFWLHCSPACVFFSSSSWKERKTFLSLCRFLMPLQCLFSRVWTYISLSVEQRPSHAFWFLALRWFNIHQPTRFILVQTKNLNLSLKQTQK